MLWTWVLRRSKSYSWRKLSRSLRRGNSWFNLAKKQRVTSWFSRKTTSLRCSKSCGVQCSLLSVKQCLSRRTLIWWTQFCWDSAVASVCSVNSEWLLNVRRSYLSSAVSLVSSLLTSSFVRRTCNRLKPHSKSQRFAETILDDHGKSSSSVSVNLTTTSSSDRTSAEISTSCTQRSKSKAISWKKKLTSITVKSLSNILINQKSIRSVSRQSNNQIISFFQINFFPFIHSQNNKSNSPSNKLTSYQPHPCYLLSIMITCLTILKHKIDFPLFESVWRWDYCRIHQVSMWTQLRRTWRLEEPKNLLYLENRRSNWV